jgi:5-methylcytosine-specific restriction protein A
MAQVDQKPTRRRDTGPTAATVALVGVRDGWACASCGRSIAGGVRGVGWSVQHRVARGAGGSRRLELNLPANLLILCGSAVGDGCHPRVERRGADDLAAGFWLRQWTDGLPTDPATLPVRHARYGLVLLDNSGGWTATTPDLEPAA